jgi:hypothetical protein
MLGNCISERTVTDRLLTSEEVGAVRLALGKWGFRPAKALEKAVTDVVDVTVRLLPAP